MWKRPVCAAMLLAAALHAPLSAPGAAAAPKVVVSIKPVHSLVAGVMAGIGKPELMVTGTASPHTYQMRPSDARKLSEADLIVWIGEDMETFLRRPIANTGRRAAVLTLHEAARMHLLRNREGGIWEDEHDHAHKDEHKHGHDKARKDEHDDDHKHGHDKAHKDEHDDAHKDEHGHAHGEFDMHIWLDPGNAQRIVEVVAEALIRLDRANEKAYRRNAAAMRKRIADRTAALRRQLAPVRDRGFIVFHDAYRYFEQAFKLKGIGTIAIDPGRPPSAKRVAELRKALAARHVRCVFSEPQFEPALVRTVIGGTRVQTATLDPLGAGLAPGPDAWFGIMQSLADTFSKCLGGR